MCILRRRRGTSGTGLVAPLGTLVAAAVCVPGVALGDIDAHAAWQAWHHITSQITGDIDVHSAWQVWHFTASHHH